MKRGAMWILGIFLFATLSAFAQEAPLAPGGIRVNGFTNEFEQFYLDVTALQGGADLSQILAVKNLLGAPATRSCSPRWTRPRPYPSSRRFREKGPPP